MKNNIEISKEHRIRSIYPDLGKRKYYLPYNKDNIKNIPARFRIVSPELLPKNRLKLNPYQYIFKNAITEIMRMEDTYKAFIFMQQIQMLVLANNPTLRSSEIGLRGARVIVFENYDEQGKRDDNIIAFYDGTITPITDEFMRLILSYDKERQTKLEFLQDIRCSFKYYASSEDYKTVMYNEFSKSMNNFGIADNHPIIRAINERLMGGANLTLMSDRDRNIVLSYNQGFVLKYEIQEEKDLDMGWGGILQGMLEVETFIEEISIDSLTANTLIAYFGHTNDDILAEGEDFIMTILAYFPTTLELNR